MEEEGRKEAAKIARTAEKSDFQNGILSGGAVTAVASPSSQWAPPSSASVFLHGLDAAAVAAGNQINPVRPTMIQPASQPDMPGRCTTGRDCDGSHVDFGFRSHYPPQ